MAKHLEMPYGDPEFIHP